MKLSKTTIRLDYLVLFVLNAAGMILELVAARLMSPYFGNSNFVWTAIIGIILLAGSLGNLIGGKLASLEYARTTTNILLIIAAIYLAITPLIGAPILEAINETNQSVQIASVIGSVIFFLIPATILGIITPIVMKEHIEQSDDKGRESGRITAIIAIGSLVGTFAGGFWLIPIFGTKTIFSLLALTILLCVILFRFSKEVKKNYPLVIIFTILYIVAFAISIFSLVRASQPEDIISIDTEYGRIIIEDGDYDGEPVRYYKQSGAYSSATFLDTEKHFDLVHEYLKKYDLMFDFLNVNNVAMIGGAAYQYPKYYISHFQDKAMDVIEIDPVSTEIAKKYFFLDDLIRKFDLDDSGRLGLYTEDGRIFLANTEKKYDAILNDAFSGEVPVATLTTTEAAKIIKSALNPGGVYISNILGAVSGDKGRFLRSEYSTLRQVFKHVYVVRVYKNAKLSNFTNWMLIATDNDYDFKDYIDLELDGNEIILTDDYNPIDSLILTDYFED